MISVRDIIHFVTAGYTPIELYVSVSSDWQKIVYIGLLMISLYLLRVSSALTSLMDLGHHFYGHVEVYYMFCRFL